jgi:xanthine dehydrogenase YagR molybdenum-binding subunit
MSQDDETRGRGITRRGFLSGTGLTVAAAGLAQASDALAVEVAHPTVLGPGAVSITLEVNGAKKTLAVEPRTTLAEALRFGLGLTGTKIGCDRGACSACTVHLDGTPVPSCMTLAIDVGARKVKTIEGLAQGDTLHPVQAQFIAHDAMQCGFCTPGMIMSCAALIARNPHPTLDDVKTAVSGNLCRCGTYPKVFAATLAAAGEPLPPGTQVLAHVEEVVVAKAEPPADEPPPWGPAKELHVVGKPTPRLDGKLKVTGAARYTADVRLPGMLFARRVTSPHPHARVKSIDTHAAAALPGVKAVQVIEHLVDEGAELRDRALERGKFPTVRYAGQMVAAVAATTQAIADEAARLVKVEYEPLPFVVDLDRAMQPSAPLVFAGAVDDEESGGGGGSKKGLGMKGNVRGPSEKTRGDVAGGLREAALTVSGQFDTHVQTHSALETHGVVADWRADGLTVYASTQGTESVRDELAEVFKLPKTKIRVVTEFMGGGFGAKFGAGSYGVVATQLSKQAGAPVRLMLDRAEEHLCVGNRPSTRQTLTVGAKKDGTLTALKLESYGSGGVATGAGVGFFADRIYPVANFSSRQFDVFTHVGPAAAFRAPGNPQGAFGLEQIVDELAEKLKLDPLALRDRIDVIDGGAGARNDAVMRKRERALGAERFGWHKRRPPGSDEGPLKRGMGVAQSLWGRFVDLESACEVRLHKDGSIELRSSVQDIGTGTRTALGQVVAEELGVRAEDVTVHIGDTQFPAGPSSGGSKTLSSISPAARTAAYKAKRELFKSCAKELGASAEQLHISDGKIVAPDGKSLPWKKATARLTADITAQAARAPDYGGNPRAGLGGVQFAEVLVDTETGVIKVERMLAVHDCGRVINPLAVQSQINGGILHGLSYALYEERHVDVPTGHVMNANLDQYKIAGARETPQIEVMLLDEYLGKSGTDVSGIGEPANVPTAAAIANAVYNAIGVRVRELPMRPHVVLAALGKVAGVRR